MTRPLLLVAELFTVLLCVCIAIAAAVVAVDGHPEAWIGTVALLFVAAVIADHMRRDVQHHR